MAVPYQNKRNGGAYVAYRDDLLNRRKLLQNLCKRIPKKITFEKAFGMEAVIFELPRTLFPSLVKD